jgi:exodeoxyribonuclease-1
LAKANGLLHEAAHDALSDVRATIALARLIRQNNPKLFDFALSLHKKDKVAAELRLPTTVAGAKPFLHVSGMFPAKQGCLAIMWPLASHPTNKNELLAWDLAHDPRELSTLNADTLRLRLFTRTDELPEGMTRLPLKSIHLNKSPMVVGNVQTLTPVMAKRWSIDLELAAVHAQYARDMPDMSGIWPAVFARPSLDAQADVDQDLYGGFIGNGDRQRLNQIRAMSPAAMATARLHFDDARLATLVLRYRARNFPDTLSAEEAMQWQTHRAACLLDGAGGARTIEQLLAEIDQLSETVDERSHDILGALYDYADHIAPERNAWA